MPTYNFCNEEILALDNLRESTCKLLAVTNGITKKLVNHITTEEAKEILMLRGEIERLYNNYNYHFASVKPFEDWIHEKAKVIIENYR